MSNIKFTHRLIFKHYIRKNGTIVLLHVTSKVYTRLMLISVNTTLHSSECYYIRLKAVVLRH